MRSGTGFACLSFLRSLLVAEALTFACSSAFVGMLFGVSGLLSSLPHIIIIIILLLLLLFKPTNGKYQGLDPGILGD